MSLKREVVRDVQPIGERAWFQCDGCAVKGPVSELKYPQGMSENPDPFPRAQRVPGWVTVLENPVSMYSEIRRWADLCPRCLDFRVDRALEMGALPEGGR